MALEKGKKKFDRILNGLMKFNSNDLCEFSTHVHYTLASVGLSMEAISRSSSSISNSSSYVSSSATPTEQQPQQKEAPQLLQPQAQHQQQTEASVVQPSSQQRTLLLSSLGTSSLFTRGSSITTTPVQLLTSTYRKTSGSRISAPKTITPFEGFVDAPPTRAPTQPPTFYQAIEAEAQTVETPAPSGKFQLNSTDDILAKSLPDETRKCRILNGTINALTKTLADETAPGTIKFLLLLFLLLCIFFLSLTSSFTYLSSQTHNTFRTS
jgi:hypothetical protein